LLPAQRLTRHAVFIAIQRANTALRQIKLRLLAARHFPTVPLAGAGESTESGSAGPSAETATVREAWFATESAAPQGHRSIRYGPTGTCWKVNLK